MRRFLIYRCLTIFDNFYFSTSSPITPNLIAIMEDNIETSSEALRVAVPLMSRHGAGCSPTSYAIWYEYVRCTNLLLNGEIDEVLKNKAKLTTLQTVDLYQKYVVGRAERELGRTKAEIVDLIGKLNAKFVDASEGTSVFAEQLQVFGNKLLINETPNELSVSVNEMGDCVSAIAEKMTEVVNDLSRSQTDVETLLLELHRAREEAMIDALSQLNNRRAYEIGLEKFFDAAQVINAPLSAILIDIDFFKKVNDTHGHLVGDQVIRVIAQALSSNVKGKDFVARFGGEEFIVLLPDTPLLGALALAKHLLQVIAKLKVRKLNSSEILGAITVSAGVAQLKPNESSIEFIGRADHGLLQAKASGRNRVCIGTSFDKATNQQGPISINTTINTLSDSSLLQVV
jgi:diguanylate cyclase